MFEALPGQTAIKEFFSRALADGELSHAYLFSGREGLAKTAFAREVGVALVAECGGCGHCQRCDAARRGLHPDLHLLEREGDLIRVDQIDPLVADLSLKPFAGTRRAWVIPEIEYLHQAAANKLLKSIEEPPSHVFFLLVTDRLERVLPTIISRCQLVEFGPLSDGEVRDELFKRYGLEGDEAEALTRLSAGSIERAQRLADDALGPRRRREYLRCSAAIAARGAGRAAPFADEFVGILNDHLEEIKEAAATRLDERCAELKDRLQDERELKWHLKQAELHAKREEGRLRRLAAFDAVDALISWIRDLWVVACGGLDVLWNRDCAGELMRAAVGSPDHYAQLLVALGQTRKDLSFTIDQRLALQALFARFEEVAESG